MYIGMFINGAYEGKGKYFIKNDTEVEGLWKSGVLIVSYKLDK